MPLHASVYVHKTIRRARPWTLLLMLLAATGLTSAAAPGGGAAATATAPAAAGKTLFVMVPKGAHPFYGPMWQGFEDAARKYDVTVQKSEPKEFDLPSQVETLENLVAQKPAGIAISAIDDQGLKAVIEKAEAAGVQVITFDAPAPSTKALCFVGMVNEAAGYHAGVEMARAMKNQGDLLVLQGALGAPSLEERFTGFKKALAETAPNIKILDRVDTQGRLSIAIDKTAYVLTAHPGLAGIFGISSECVPGAAKAVKDANAKVILAGFGDDPETIAAIKDGTAQFCVVANTYQTGWTALEKLVDAANGKTLEKVYDTGSLIVGKKNVETYQKDAQEALKK